ncbi:MAG: S-methyl-5'-thioadenosine phosphorylase [Patescibacteria group bacterium]|jgi:5'-methylthioadenosine phosphorylase
MNIDSKIRKIPNWPKEGVLFYDITTLFEDKDAFKYVVDKLCQPYEGIKIDKIVGIDARGFLLASSMAYKLGAGVAIVRKKGKLPHKTISRDYTLEYGSNTIEMHEDAIKPGERVVVVDDLVATGGTMKAATELVGQLEGIIMGISWIVDLPFLGGSRKLNGYNCYNLIRYNNEEVENKNEAVEEETAQASGRAVKVGIIGGSGLENLDILQDKKQEKINTPFGAPSDLVTTGKIGEMDVVILPRHGRNHTIKPTDVNFRANIWALKELGVTHILAATACGSLKEEIKPGDFVILNQFIDRTTKRAQTFYEGRVCHIPMAEPFCNKLGILAYQTARQLGIPAHPKGTVVTIEGPRFSTKAESNLFRFWNADVVNMTVVPEAVLAREAGICYQSIAMSTDYDCWREETESVTTEGFLEVMKQNAEKMEKLLVEVVRKIDFIECKCREDIKSAVI